MNNIMKINKITNEDLKVNIHHVGGIGNAGPTELLMGVNKFSHWIFYDANKDALAAMTDHKEKKFTLVNKCISDYNGEGEFHTTLTSSASSMLRPAKSASEYIRTKKSLTTWGEETKIIKKQIIISYVILQYLYQKVHVLTLEIFVQESELMNPIFWHI